MKKHNKYVCKFHLYTTGPDINVQSTAILSWGASDKRSTWSNSNTLFSSKSLPPSLKNQVNMCFVPIR